MLFSCVYAPLLGHVGSQRACARHGRGLHSIDLYPWVTPKDAHTHTQSRDVVSCATSVASQTQFCVLSRSHAEYVLRSRDLT